MTDTYELEERIAIMHYDGRVPLEMAERLAREEKAPNPPPPQNPHQNPPNPSQTSGAATLA